MVASTWRKFAISRVRIAGCGAGTEVAVGSGVDVGGIAVAVGATCVAVGATAVAVGGTWVAVGGMAVDVGAGVDVGGPRVGSAVGRATAAAPPSPTVTTARIESGWNTQK